VSVGVSERERAVSLSRAYLLHRYLRYPIDTKTASSSHASSSAAAAPSIDGHHHRRCFRSEAHTDGSTLGCRRRQCRRSSCASSWYGVRTRTPPRQRASALRVLATHSPRRLAVRVCVCRANRGPRARECSPAADRVLLLAAEPDTRSIFIVSDGPRDLRADRGHRQLPQGQVALDRPLVHHVGAAKVDRLATRRVAHQSTRRRAPAAHDRRAA